jgi:hypothetical protein
MKLKAAATAASIPGSAVLIALLESSAAWAQPAGPPQAAADEGTDVAAEQPAPPAAGPAEAAEPPAPAPSASAVGTAPAAPVAGPDAPAATAASAAPAASAQPPAAQPVPGQPAARAEPTEPQWSDRIEPIGDLRYRLETIDQQGDDLRHRHRIRARFGFDVMVLDGLDVVVGLGTGSSDDPVSNNQSLDEAFTSKPIWLDLAFFDYHPAFVEGVHAFGGKMKNPLCTVGKSELLWDPDLNPEGLALRVQPAFGTLEPFVNGVLFWVQENSDTEDNFIVGGQAGLKLSFDVGHLYLLAGGRYIDFRDIRGEQVYWDPEDSFGNSATDVAGDGILYYDNDYNIAGGFVEIGGKVASYPWSLFGDFARNTAVDENDTGWLFGVSVGKCKEALDFCLRYIYRRVEADAVVGIFTDSDFKGGGTDGKGHEWNVGVQLAERVGTQVTYFYNQTPLENSIDYHRSQIDLKLEF